MLDNIWKSHDDKTKRHASKQKHHKGDDKIKRLKLEQGWVRLAAVRQEGHEPAKNVEKPEHQYWDVGGVEFYSAEYQKRQEQKWKQIIWGGFDYGNAPGKHEGYERQF